MNTCYCFCSSLVVSVALVLACGTTPAFADIDVAALPSYSAPSDIETDAFPMSVELKAQERHERPSMKRSLGRDSREVENVLPQIAVPGHVEPAESNEPNGLGIMAPNAFSATVHPPMNEAPKQNTIKIYSRTVGAQQPTTSPAGSLFDPNTVQLSDMTTAWGYGPRENKYNAAILNASQKCWPHQRVPLHPLLFKSLVANESAFNPSAVSYTGATGLTQLTPDTMRRFGLNWSSSRDPQKAVPAGVKVLAEKARVILEPQNYAKITGLSPARCPYAQLVAEAYKNYGEPSTEQSYYLMLGAYNAGGGTILRAMAKAYKQGRDPREWSNLVGDPNNKLEAPLFKACQEIFPHNASAKYREISAYPDKIMKLYYRSQMRLI